MRLNYWPTFYIFTHINIVFLYSMSHYRMVKRLLMDAMSPPFSSVTRRFDNFEYDVNTTQENDDFTVTQLVTLAPPDGKRRSTDYNIEAK